MISLLRNILIPFETNTSIKELLEYLKRNNTRINFNYRFFEDLVMQFSEATKNWVDIEQYYYDTLKKESHLYKEKDGKERYLRNILKLNECMDKITNALNQYISNHQ